MGVHALSSVYACQFRVEGVDLYQDSVLFMPVPLQCRVFICVESWSVQGIDLYRDSVAGMPVPLQCRVLTIAGCYSVQGIDLHWDSVAGMPVPLQCRVLIIAGCYSVQGRDGSYGLLRRPIRYNTLLIRNTRIIRKHIYAILGGTLGLHQPPSNHHELSPQPPEHYNASR